jgi:rubrerythrin
MDLDTFLRDPQSRRRFFRTSGVSLVGGSAMSLAGCTDDTKNPTKTGPTEANQADVELLNGLLDLELRAVAGYIAGAAHLKGSALQTAKLFLEQEQAHADALASAIKDADGTPNRAKSSYDVPRLRTQGDALRFMIDLEQTAIASYIDALPKFSDASLRATAASIITAEAEHAAVLAEALGRDPVPAAFVTGAVS